MSQSTRFASDLNLSVPVAKDGEFQALKIKTISVWPPVVLAPMAGITNYPYRSLCRSYGAGLFVSEMITARGYLHGNRMTRLLVSSQADEKPRSVQIYGADPVDVGEMARELVAEGVDHIDMNFGCPVPKVTRHGGGSAVPLKPRLLARIVRAAVAGAGEIPVTIKVRKGIDEELLTYLNAGEVAEAEGAAAIGLHSRTASELYSGSADWSAITKLKEHVSIPVLGNGDIWECWDALRMMRETGCDGVIVGRGCLGRPWLFGELAQIFDGSEPDTPPDLGGVVKVALKHAEALSDFFEEGPAMKQMRKWLGWYTKGFHGAAALRSSLSRVESLTELRDLLHSMPLTEAFPMRALRMGRAKRGGKQRVKLPEAYLDDLLDDTPPRGPRSLEEIEAWERAHSGG
jgi:nifR3 family TIM-barrel protein